MKWFHVLPMLAAAGAAPAQGQPADEEEAIVERYSYTSLWAGRSGTRIRQRSQDARIEFLDLTAEPETRAN